MNNNVPENVRSARSCFTALSPIAALVRAKVTEQEDGKDYVRPSGHSYWSAQIVALCLPLFIRVLFLSSL